MFGPEFCGFFATRDELSIASVHVDSQITFFHCTALGRPRYSPYTHWYLNHSALMEM